MTLEQMRLMGEIAQKHQLRLRIERVEDASLAAADPKQRDKTLRKWREVVSD
jgi:hypothetical protein